MTVLRRNTKTCFQIYMHSMSRVPLLARPSAHAETFCYKSVWMSAMKLPLGTFWPQSCPPGTHYVAKFNDRWFYRQEGRRGKNEFNYSDTTKQQSHCGFYFTPAIFFSSSILLFPPCGTFGANFGLTGFFAADQGQAGNMESLRQEPVDWGKSEKQ